MTDYVPDVTVEIAFNAGYSTPEADRVWTDVSDWVDGDQTFTINRGRGDEFNTAEASRLTGLRLDNTDGRFTAERPASPYYPNVKIGRPIRVTSTPLGGTPSVRFVGYIDQWPVEWAGTGAHATATITAASRMARLGFDAKIRTLMDEFLAAAPRNFWPLQDTSYPFADGNYSYLNPLVGPALLAAPLGQEPDLSIPAGLLVDGNAAQFAGTRRRLNAYSSYGFAPLRPADGVSFEGFLTIDSGSATDKLIVWLEDIPGDLHLRFSYSALGHVYVYLYETSSGTAIVLRALEDVVFGRAFHFAVTVVGQTVSLYLDGSLQDQQTGAWTGAGWDALIVGGEVPTGFAFRISHLAVNANPTGLFERAMAGSIFYDDTASERIARYAEKIALIAPAELNLDPDTNPVTAIDIAGKTALEAMRAVETTEGGVLFDSRENRLTFHSRARRFAELSSFTLDIGAHEVESGVAPKLDRSTLVNDIAVKTTTGEASGASNAASIADYGYARTSVELATTLDAAVAAATWDVNVYGEPRPRIPALVVDLLPLSTTRQSDLLDLDVSSRVTVENFPDQASATSMDFMVEGCTESINSRLYSLSFNVSPASIYDVWTIEHPIYGQYDAYPIAF